MMPDRPPPERQSMPRTRWGDGWTQTGRYRWRRRFFLGPILEVEMERNAWTPTATNPKATTREVTWWKGGSWHSYEVEVF